MDIDETHEDRPAPEYCARCTREPDRVGADGVPVCGLHETATDGPLERRDPVGDERECGRCGGLGHDLDDDGIDSCGRVMRVAGRTCRWCEGDGIQRCWECDERPGTRTLRTLRDGVPHERLYCDACYPMTAREYADRIVASLLTQAEAHGAALTAEQASAIGNNLAQWLWIDREMQRTDGVE